METGLFVGRWCPLRGDDFLGKGGLSRERGVNGFRMGFRDKPTGLDQLGVGVRGVREISWFL